MMPGSVNHALLDHAPHPRRRAAEATRDSLGRVADWSCHQAAGSTREMSMSKTVVRPSWAG
jgi:hypothetical protein